MIAGTAPTCVCPEVHGDGGDVVELLATQFTGELLLRVVRRGVVQQVGPCFEGLLA